MLSISISPTTRHSWPFIPPSWRGKAWDAWCHTKRSENCHDASQDSFAASQFRTGISARNHLHKLVPAHTRRVHFRICGQKGKEWPEDVGPHNAVVIAAYTSARSPTGDDDGLAHERACARSTYGSAGGASPLPKLASHLESGGGCILPNSQDLRFQLLVTFVLSLSRVWHQGMANMCSGLAFSSLVGSGNCDFGESTQVCSDAEEETS